MATLVISRLPEGVGAQMYDAVNEKLNEAGGPPKGLIAQAAADIDGQFQVVAIWETAEDSTRFREDRLIPAIRSVVGDEAFAAMPDAERPEAEIHDLVVP
jgi:hypothetical protein